MPIATRWTISRPGRRIEELERELRETRERSDAFTRIVESIDHHVYINEVLPGGGRKTLFVGPGRDRLLGGVPEDGDWGRAWIEAVHPDDRARYAEHTARYLRGEMSEVRCRLIGLDGVTRWIVGRRHATAHRRPPDRRGNRARGDGGGRRRAATARGRAHGRSDGALQPPPLLRGTRGGAGALAARLAHAGTAAARRRPFQGGQRHLRPSGRRRGAERDRHAAARCRPHVRHRGALGRRGVHRAGALARARALALAHLPGHARRA